MTIKKISGVSKGLLVRDYVPYVGANANVDLGSFDFTTTGTANTGQHIVDVNNSQAFLVRKEGGGQNVLIVDTTDPFGKVGINIQPLDVPSLKYGFQFLGRTPEFNSPGDGVHIECGKGGGSAFGNTGDGGEFRLFTGFGGDSIGGTNSTGADGGDYDIFTRSGGNASGGTSTNVGGNSGNMEFSTGIGGTGTGTGASNGVGGSITFNTNFSEVGTFLNDGSGLQHNDGIKTFYGNAADTSITFNGSDLIITSEGTTASDEVHFTNFDKYTFDNDIETIIGSGRFDGGVGIGQTPTDLLNVIDAGDTTWENITSMSLDINNTVAFLVEQDGVNDNTFLVDTLNARVGINMIPTVELDVTGDATITGSITSGKVIHIRTSQVLTAATTITVDSTLHNVSAASPISLTNTPTLAAGIDGQKIIIVGTSDTNTIILRDDRNLAYTDLFLSGEVDMTLALGDMIELFYDSSMPGWCELSRSIN